MSERDNDYADRAARELFADDRELVTATIWLTPELGAILAVRR